MRPRAPAAARPAVPLALAFLAGTALGGAVTPGLALAAAVTSIVLAVAALALAWARPRGPARPGAVGLLLAAVVALGVARRLDARLDETALLDIPGESTPAIVKGHVVHEPTPRPGGAVEVVIEVESGWIGDGAWCEWGEAPGAVAPAPAGIRIRAHLEHEERRRAGDLLPGRRVELAGLLTTPREPRLPDGFDVAGEMRREGTCALLRVEQAWRLEGTAGASSLVARLARRARAAIRGAGLARDDEAVLRALVLGDRSGLSGAARDAFRATSMVHAVTVSGLHVALLVWVLSGLAGFLPGRARGVLVALGLVFYLALAGPHPGVLRATIAAVLLALAGASGRGGDGWNRLAVALVAVLGWDPSSIEEAGFQLTFGTVAGILGLAGPFADAIAARGRFLAARRQIAISAAGFVAHAPILVARLGMFSPVALVANVPVVPLVTLALLFGLVGTALAMLHPALGQPFLELGGLAAHALVATVELLARVPLARVELARPSPAALVLALGGAALALSLAARGVSKRATRPLLIVSVLLLLAASLPRPRRGGEPARLVVTPEAALLVLPDGRSLAVGEWSRTVERALVRVAVDAGGPGQPEGPLVAGTLGPGLTCEAVAPNVFRLEAGGRATLVVLDGRGLRRVLETVPEGLLRASVLVAPEGGAAIDRLIERTRPFVVPRERTVVVELETGAVGRW